MKNVTMIWGMFKGQNGKVVKVSGTKNLIVKLESGIEIDASTDHVEEIQNLKFHVGQAVRMDGDAYKVVGYNEEKKRFKIARLNPCNGEIRKGAKVVEFSESRIKGWNE